MLNKEKEKKTNSGLNIANRQHMVNAKCVKTTVGYELITRYVTLINQIPYSKYSDARNRKRRC